MQKRELIKPKETPFLNQCWVITFLGRLRRGSATNVNLRPLRLDSKSPAKTLLCCFVPQPPWLLSLPPLWEWNGKAEHWNMRGRQSSMMDQKAQTRWVCIYIYIHTHMTTITIKEIHCIPWNITNITMERRWRGTQDRNSCRSWGENPVEWGVWRRKHGMLSDEHGIRLVV